MENQIRKAPTKENVKLSVAELREKLQAVTKLDPPPGWLVEDFLPSTRNSLILPQGAVVEWVGENAESALCRFFKKHSTTQIAWVDQKLQVFPPAFSQRGVSLKRVLFIESEQHWLWALEQCLRSGSFQFVVAPSDRFPEAKLDVFLRKCQLLAERSRTTFCLVSRTPLNSYSIRYRIEADEAPADSRSSTTSPNEKILSLRSL
jgi:hypothetical protein